MKKSPIGFCLTVFAILISTTSVFSQAVSPTTRLTEIKITQKFENYTLVEALRLLSDRYKIPIGYEEAFSEENDNILISLQFSNSSVRNVLDELTKNDPRYEWKSRNGIINVIPKMSSKVLDINIKSISVKEMDLNDFGIFVVQLPDFKVEARKLGFTGDTAVHYDGPLKKPISLNIEMENVSVETILNEILRRGDSNFWYISRHGATGEYVAVNF